jgi:hypothetical protein
MDIGLTVGDDLDRLAASPARFDFCELGVGEQVFVPAATSSSTSRTASGWRRTSPR